MLQGNLLISAEATIAIIAVCLGVFAIASVLYGVFRKFSQMGWLPWQLPVIFGIALLTGYVPADMGVAQRYAAVVAIFVGGTAIVFAVGGVIRYFMHARLRPANILIRALDRVLGAVTALLGYAVIVLCIGGLALPFLTNVIPDIAATIGIAEIPIVASILPYALDFFVVTVLACTIQAGYRVGFGRALIYLIMFALTLASAAAAIWLTLAVTPFKAFASLIAGGFSSLSAPLASLLGKGIAAVILFIVFFLVSCILGFLLNKLLRKIKYVRVLKWIDGILYSVLLLAIVLALFAGVHYGIQYVAHADLSAIMEQIPEQLHIPDIQEIALRLEAFVTSSTLSRMLYLSNPLLLISV